MAVFKDRDGRDWHADVTIASVRRVRDSGIGVDLLDVTDQTKNVVERLLDDPVLLVAVLHEVCRPEIEQRGVTADGFGEALSDGEVIDAATTALLDSLAHFIPSHRGRAMATAAVQAMRLTDDLGLTETISEALEQRGLQFITSPESSDATPDR